MMSRHWALPLAFASGIAFGTALMLRRRREAREFQRTQDRDGLHKWEDEGGNLAPARMRRAG